MGYITYEKQIFIMQLAQLMSSQYRILVHIESDTNRFLLSTYESQVMEFRGFDLCSQRGGFSEAEYDFIFSTEPYDNQGADLVLVTQNYMDLSAIQKRLCVGGLEPVMFLVNLHWMDSRIKHKTVECLMDPHLGATKLHFLHEHGFDDRDLATAYDYIFEMRGTIKGHTHGYKKALLVTLTHLLKGDANGAKVLLHKGEQVR
jgi:hypothetical protein